MGHWNSGSGANHPRMKSCSKVIPGGQTYGRTSWSNTKSKKRGAVEIEILQRGEKRNIRGPQRIALNPYFNTVFFTPNINRQQLSLFILF